MMTQLERYEVVLNELAELIQNKNDLIAWKNSRIIELEKRLEEAERKESK